MIGNLPLREVRGRKKMGVDLFLGEGTGALLRSCLRKDRIQGGFFNRDKVEIPRGKKVLVIDKKKGEREAEEKKIGHNSAVWGDKGTTKTRGGLV